MTTATFIHRPMPPIAADVRHDGVTRKLTPGMNALIASILLAGLGAGMASGFADCRHWFMFPVMCVGVLTGMDLVAWARRQVDTFDPVVFAAGTAFVGYCLAPMMHVAWDIYDPTYAAIDDWRARFGQYALLLIPALLLFRLGQRMTFRARRPARTLWAIDNTRFVGGLTLALLMSGAAVAYLQIQFGGLQKDAILDREAVEALGHLSWIVMLEQPFTFLLTLGVIQLIYDPQNPKQRSMLFVLIMLASLTVVQFMLVGLRGSRSATVSAVFIAAGLIHYRVRRFKVGHALAGLGLLCAFMYFYLFFKKRGSEGLEALRGGAEARAILQEEGQFSFQTMVLSDLARADLQTFMMYRLLSQPGEYRLRWGAIYMNALLGFIPRAVWPSKPYLVKSNAGTELEYGAGTFDPGFHYSVRIFGLPGEAMLNFGVWGVPPIFFAFGLLLGWYRGRVTMLDPRDARLIIVPMLTYASMSAWIGDSDNLVFATLINGVLPFAVLYNGSRRTSRAVAALP